jgi:hypothetical protein
MKKSYMLVAIFLVQIAWAFGMVSAAASQING